MQRQCLVWLAGAVLVLAGAAARADDRAAALLKETSAATARLQSLKAEVEIRTGTRTSTAVVQAKRPNLARVDLKGAINEQIISDGTRVTTYVPERNQYVQRADAPNGRSTYLPYGVDLGFFHPEAIAVVPTNTTVTYVGKQTVDGTEYDVVQRVSSQGGTLTTRYFILPKDHLIHRITMTLKPASGEELTTMVRVLSLQENPPLEASAFRWTAPANATVYKPPAPVTIADLEKNLLPVGQAPPDFNLPQPQGGRLSLSDAEKGRKATIVNFWFYG